MQVSNTKLAHLLFVPKSQESLQPGTIGRSSNQTEAITPKEVESHESATTNLIHTYIKIPVAC